jgi:hypothetical protein
MTKYLRSEHGCIYAITHAGSPLTFDGASRRVGGSTMQPETYLVCTESPVREIVGFHVEQTGDGTWITSVPTLAPSISRQEFEGLPEEIRDLYHQRVKMVQCPILFDVSDHEPFDVEDPMTLAGDPPPANWHPSAIGLALGPQFSAFVPGHLSGFRAAAKAMAGEFGEAYDNDGAKAPIKVYVKRAYEPPRFIAAKTKRDRPRVAFMTETVLLPASDLIAGETLAAARSKWNAELVAMRVQLAAVAASRVCAHCDGRGEISAAANGGT